MDSNAKEEIVVKDLTEESVVDDLSIVPLGKDTFAVCELCGRVGRRGQFNQRHNRYCSRYCHSSFKSRKNCNWKFQIMENTDHMEGMIPLEPLPQLHSWHASFSDLQAGPLKHNAAIVANSYEWKDELFGCDFLAAPVSLFKHAPLHEMWDNTFEGMKVEVKNTDCDNYSEKLGDYFWVATVLKVKGYMGLLRYEGFGSDDSKDFWVNLCCAEVHPVGWCATRGKPLIPPKTIEEKYTDWKKFLVKQLTGARTLPANFYSKLNESLKSRFSVGTIMEVVDKNRISQVKVASVHEIVGKRLHVKYYDSCPEDNGFWCHEDSPLIHPVGWAFKVGHPLDGNQNYCSRVAAGRLTANDATPDMFHKFASDEPPIFRVGQKLEAIDPLNLSAICAATVMQTLRDGYMMVRIDCYEPAADGADWFCYHQRSPCIFPAGFAVAHDIPLKPPHGHPAETFNWEEYLSQTGGRAAPSELFTPRGHLVSHGFVANMKLECADLMDPRLVCVATISRVVADMLKIHFDGWGVEYDQWLWAHSTDMYPVGWSRAVRHRLEGPLRPPPRPRPRTRPRPRPPRVQRPARRPGRRKRGGASLNSQQPGTTEESSQNSDTGDNKSMSPFPTSVSEMSGDVDTRHSTNSDRMETDQGDSVGEGRHDGERDGDTESRENESPPQQVPEGKFEPQSDNSSEQPSKSPEPTPPSLDSLDTDSPDDKPASPKKSKIEEDDKVIPRLVNTTVPQDVLNSVDVENWSPVDVSRFLTVNDCQPYCEYFTNITGPKLLQLTKDEIIELLKMKVGPSLKIFDLVQQLKYKIKQPHRLLGR